MSASSAETLTPLEAKASENVPLVPVVSLPVTVEVVWPKVNTRTESSVPLTQ